MTLDTLYTTLSERRRPEDVADLVHVRLEGRLAPWESSLLERASARSLRKTWLGYTSMRQDWARAVGMHRQVGRARELFESSKAIDAFDTDAPDRIADFLARVSPEIHKARDENDFLADRLDRAERRAAGLRLSRRRYDKLWRVLRRMERRLDKLVVELRKVRLTRIGKQRLAPYLVRADFERSEASACFVAYMVARLGLRSTFTVWGQAKAFDEIAHMLLQRCFRDPSASFYAIAHVYPAPEVLARLSDDERGRLLASSYEVLREAATVLDELYEARPFDRERMVVRRGDDSSTWNQVAGAFNAARDHWIGLLHAMGAGHVVERMCIPKVMRLIAGDVAFWHRAVGHSGDPNVRVAASLPPGWSVARGEAGCEREDVRLACSIVGIDPVKTGWIAPRDRTHVEAFRPTPELVHGVAVGSPYLATVLRKLGVFSGRPP